MKIYFCNQPPQKIAFDAPDVKFREKDKVPNCIRGKFEYESDSNKWHYYNEEAAKSISVSDNKKGSYIALILESPHKYEFKLEAEVYVPKFPAQGQTGERIEKRIAEVVCKNFIEKLDTSKKYQLILINPVQYQASCYNQLKNLTNYEEIRRKLTNNVFRKLFAKNGFNQRHEFIQILKVYTPDFIINACTFSLKPVVETAIKESGTFKDDCYVKEKHPSMW